MESPSKNWTREYKFPLETYLSKINSLLDTHALFKKTSKYKLKFKTKPWITSGLQKPVALKNELLKKFIQLKEPHMKLCSHPEYKKYKDMLSTFWKEVTKVILQNILNLTGITSKVLGKE